MTWESHLVSLQSGCDNIAESVGLLGEFAAWVDLVFLAQHLAQVVCFLCAQDCDKPGTPLSSSPDITWHCAWPLTDEDTALQNGDGQGGVKVGARVCPRPTHALSPAVCCLRSLLSGRRRTRAVTPSPTSPLIMHLTAYENRSHRITLSPIPDLGSVKQRCVQFSKEC